MDGIPEAGVLYPSCEFRVRGLDILPAKHEVRRTVQSIVEHTRGFDERLMVLVRMKATYQSHDEGIARNTELGTKRFTRRGVGPETLHIYSVGHDNQLVGSIANLRVRPRGDM